MEIEMSPGSFNFTIFNGLCIYKGSTWQVYFTANGLTEEGMLPVDLTGFTGRCTIKEDANESKVIAEPRVEIVDAKNGIFTLNLTDEETLGIPVTGDTYMDTTQYQYDVYFDDNDGDSYRALQGYIEVSPNISVGV